jgi:hypothetical protein
MQQQLNYLKTSCLLAISLGLSNVKAQDIPQASFSDAMGELTRIQQHFLPDPNAYISCRVSYYYAKESSPQHYLDSLPGQYRATHDARYSKIANTETVQDDSMLLLVYNDSHEILVNAVSPRSANQRSLFINTMDSAFVARNAASISIVQNGGFKNMSFHFSDSSRFFNCDIKYDAVSYLLQSVAYVLKTSKIAESGKPPADGDIISIRFSNYSETPFDPSTISVAKYISLNSEHKASLQPAYSSYSLYQGSPTMNASNQ